MTGVRVAEDPAADGVGTQRLDLLVSNFARVLSSEVALYLQPDSKGQLLPVISSWGLGAPRHERITRSHAGGIVGRALGAQRAAFEPLDHDHDGAHQTTKVATSHGEKAECT